MRIPVLKLLARQVVSTASGNRAIVALSGVIMLLLVYAAVSSWYASQAQRTSLLHFQQVVRANWEKMPDKHPHRMAHYGYIAFRPVSPFRFFDPGTDSYTGNAVFLEAHRQNTVNFSEAGFNTGLMRFGEFSLAMVLQMLLPLVLFFIGFGTVATDRENGTLKLLLSQGASWSEIIVGKATGLTFIAICFFIPALSLLAGGLLLQPAGASIGPGWGAWAGLFFAYLVYLYIISMIAVVVSACCRQAKGALILLIGIWLLQSVILLRATQAIGHYAHPAPSKIEFETAIEADLLKAGDSHDPDDPHYKKLRDSVLRANGVDAVEKLSFNYSGFQMKEGEKISAGLYRQHQHALAGVYQQQNDLSRWSAFVNPFTAIRQLSMALCATDPGAFNSFQQQAETYRYQLAQHMNELQIKWISNQQPADTARPAQISRQHWKAFPDFTYQPAPPAQLLRQETVSIAALLGWLLLSVAYLPLLSKKLKAV